MSVKDGWVGRYYEDFEVGDIYRFALGRTITQADNVWFTLLTMNTNQLHFNSHYAAKTEFGKPLVNSGFTLALVLGMSVGDVSQNAMANLGWDHIRLDHPVFVGDTLHVESLVLEKRESESRPNIGIVKVKTRGLNQHGKECVSFTRSIMVYKRSRAEELSSFPHPETAIEEDEDEPS
ncbi:MAG: MaoC family dehydratase [Actinobacteria bacterium]|nr:MaoC family dehydratase [Actinomycetota bacterium]